MRRRILSALTITTVVTLFAACDRTDPVAPATPKAALSAERQSSSANQLALAHAVNPLLRTKAITRATSASATVGPAGGSISLPGAGLTIVIPPGAAPVGTVITATVHNGNRVAYDFSPHGIHFAVPLIAIQDLRNTEAGAGGRVNPGSLSVGYYPDSSNVTSVTELLDVHVDVLGQTVTTIIWHFSGYLFAGGDLDGGAW